MFLHALCCLSDEMMPGAPPPPPAPPPCSAPPPPPPCQAAKPMTKISPAHLHKHLAAGPVTPAAALHQALDRFSKLTPGFQNHVVAADSRL